MKLAVSESDKDDTETISNEKKTNRKAIEPVERSTRRNKALNVKAATEKQKNVRNDKINTIEKLLTSDTPTKSKKKVDEREKSTRKKSVPNQNSKSPEKKSDRSPSTTKKGDETGKSGQKKTVPNASTKSSKKLSDSRPPSRTSRRNRTLSQSSQNIDNSSVSSRKTTSNSTPLSTPQVTTFTKKAISSRRRQVASAPPTRKVNSRAALKNTVSPKKQKDKTSKITSSLSNLNNPSILDQPQHRTRRALAQELIFNNVMTRNRASGDGVKLLEKIDKRSSTRRKSSIGTDMPTEKALSTGKSKKIVETKTSTPTRPRRQKSLENK